MGGHTDLCGDCTHQDLGQAGEPHRQAGRKETGSYVSPQDVEIARKSLIEGNPHDCLRQQTAGTVTKLLESAPLRWGEACALTRNDLLPHDLLIAIQSQGFSHIKSISAFRLVTVSADARHALDTLVRMNRALHIPNGRKEFLVAHMRDGVITQQSVDWLHRDLTAALFGSCGNPRVRVHSLRAMAVSDLAFPGWASLITRFSEGLAGADELSHYFGYERGQAWRLERAARAAGHAHPGVTLAHYLGGSLQLRSLSLAGAHHMFRAPSWAFEAIGRSHWAWRKDKDRRDDDAKCDWTFIRRTMLLQVPTDKSVSPGVNPEDSDEDDVDQPSSAEVPLSRKDTDSYVPVLGAAFPSKRSVRYLVLRLIGDAVPTAIAISGVTHATSIQLDSVLLNMNVDLQQSASALARTLKPTLRTRIRQHLQGDWGDALLDCLGAHVGIEVPNATLQLLRREVDTITWQEKAFKVGALLAVGRFCIRVVRDRARRGGFTSGLLRDTPGIADGGFACDVGEVPKFFVAPANDPHNKRDMGLLTPLTKLVCTARCALAQAGISLQSKKTGERP